MRQREPNHRFIIPISASILKNSKRYDEVLETISTPLMAMLDYDFDENRRLVVNNNIDYMYRYPDYTEHVIFVYEMMNTAISDELVQEVILLTIFDLIKTTISEVIDIPNAKLDTLVSILLSGGGKSSNAKRPLFLNYLNEKQLNKIEAIATDSVAKVKETFKLDLQAIMNQPTSSVREQL